MQSIHISKLWRGAVFTFKAEKPTYYHVDGISNGKLYYTALHNDVSYSTNLYDRFVWLRS